MNNNIPTINEILKSDLPIYTQHVYILETIFKFLSNKVIKNVNKVSFSCGLYENTFTEECYLELDHPTYTKIGIYKNNLQIYHKKISPLYDIRFEIPIKISLYDPELAYTLTKILYLEDAPKLPFTI